MHQLEADYLIVGSGAMGMAFADVILDETDCSIIMVDRYAKPGGHWNKAYPFVNLHQPSQFYGVSSKELSRGTKDQRGWNKGLYDLATGAEVMSYYDEVMKDTFLSSGRLQYFPKCEYKEDHSFECMMTGRRYQVKVNRSLVDSTHLKTTVPSTHTPSFTIDEKNHFIPINDLVNLDSKPEGYVIIGGGKTGIDACLWLLENRVDPDKITWIVSRDAWLIDRRNTQPSEEFFDDVFGSQAAQYESIAQATSIDNLFERLEEGGVLVRIDRNIKPQMFHGATISQLELEQMRRIKNVVRLGKVQRIHPSKIVLEKGEVPTSLDHVHVDCSATAVGNIEIKPVFSNGVITPQTVRPYQPVFSAALIAHVEANYEGDAKKNELCKVVTLPNHHTDWIRMVEGQLTNQFAWSQDKPLRKWISENRLDGFTKLAREVDRNDEKKMSLIKRMRGNMLPAMMKLQQFIKELESPNISMLENPQMEVQRKAFFKSQLSDVPGTQLTLGDGEILVQIEQFAYTANNITYAVVGDMIGYWKFFPPTGDGETQGWGVIPVWGFANVVESNVPDVPVGERLFGYFPPAKYLKIKADHISEKKLIDVSEHRSKLPSGYNIYYRVLNEKGYDRANDYARMVLYPLHLTSFCLWDAMQDKDWYGAQQVIVLSASSKTSTGLGYALKFDDSSPQCIGITSKRNLDQVKSLDIYDQCMSYEDLDDIDVSIPTVIVDMSGNTTVLAKLHNALGEQMKYTINVGLTHWADTKPHKDIIQERSEFFFAPGHIKKRMKEWGPAEFNKKTSTFMLSAATKTSEWLEFKEVNGLVELAKIHPSVCDGKIPANQGLIVKVT